jgi:hypothetical protein
MLCSFEQHIRLSFVVNYLSATDAAYNYTAFPFRCRACYVKLAAHSCSNAQLDRIVQGLVCGSNVHTSRIKAAWVRTIQASACRAQVDIYAMALGLWITVHSCVLLDNTAHTAPLKRILARYVMLIVPIAVVISGLGFAMLCITYGNTWSFKLQFNV